MLIYINLDRYGVETSCQKNGNCWFLASHFLWAVDRTHEFCLHFICTPVSYFIQLWKEIGALFYTQWGWNYLRSPQCNKVAVGGNEIEKQGPNIHSTSEHGMPCILLIYLIYIVKSLFLLSNLIISLSKMKKKYFCISFRHVLTFCLTSFIVNCSSLFALSPCCSVCAGGEKKPCTSIYFVKVDILEGGTVKCLKAGFTWVTYILSAVHLTYLVRHANESFAVLCFVTTWHIRTLYSQL